MRVEVFGQFAVVDGDRRWASFSTGRCREILAFLALADAAVPRRWVIENVWPGLDPKSCRNRLSVSLSILRRELGSSHHDLIGGGHQALWLAPGVQNEWSEFWATYGRFAACPDPADQSDESDKEDAAQRLLAIARGPLLIEIDHPWAQAARAETDAACRQAAAWLVKWSNDPVIVARANRRL